MMELWQIGSSSWYCCNGRSATYESAVHQTLTKVCGYQTTSSHARLSRVEIVDSVLSRLVRAIKDIGLLSCRSVNLFSRGLSVCCFVSVVQDRLASSAKLKLSAVLSIQMVTYNVLWSSGCKGWRTRREDGTEYRVIRQGSVAGSGNASNARLWLMPNYWCRLVSI